MLLESLILKDKSKLWSLPLQVHFTYAVSVGGAIIRARNTIIILINITTRMTSHSIRKGMGREILNFIIVVKRITVILLTVIHTMQSSSTNIDMYPGYLRGC